VSRLHASDSAATPTARFESFGSGEAVFAQGTATSSKLGGAEAGVLGTGNTGVIGRTSGSGNPAPSVGVFGEATSTVGSTTGVWGRIDSPEGAAVRGWANNTTGANVGVEGRSLSTNSSAVGVLGTGATGVKGMGNQIGVHGVGDTGVYGFSNSGLQRGVTGYSPAGYGVYGFSDTGFAGVFDGRSHFTGNVGIGTTSPIGRLNIVGTAGDVRGVQIDNGEIKLRGDGSGHFSIFNRSGSAKLTIEDSSSNQGMNTPPLELMTITRAGNVGIGTNAPGFRLHVNGATRTGTLAIDNYFAGTSGFTLCANSGNNQVGLCQASSLIYKTNITNLQTGLGTIMRLRPVTFDWKESGDPDLGLIAEEVERVDPSLVLFKDGRVQGVKYDRIPAVLINAIKEQQAQIERQQMKFEKLEKLVDTQNRLIASQRSRLTALEQRLRLGQRSVKRRTK
jgi:hypothetical protein